MPGTYIRTPEIRAKISAARKGQKLTAAHRHNIVLGMGSDGLRRHPLRGTHHQMMSRCYKPYHKNFKTYGAEGITVWEPWHERTTFIFSILALLGDRPENHTLDRINPWEGYMPWNVRWADRLTQHDNLVTKVDDYYSLSGEH